MQLEQLRARVKRLEELSADFADELTVWRKQLAPPEWKDRERYRTALAAARRGVEEARAVLAGALGRVERAGQAGT